MSKNKFIFFIFSCLFFDFISNKFILQIYLGGIFYGEIKLWWNLNGEIYWGGTYREPKSLANTA